MIIKSLLENTTENPSFETEHGLSLYIETGSHKILFDTGHTSAFARNAEKLKVDLSQVDIAVLSHGHYDHGDGLETFLSLNQHAPVYISQYAMDEYMDGADKYIGVNRALQGNPRLVPVKENMRLGEGLELFTGEGLSLKQPIQPGTLTARRSGVLAPDDFRHEQYLQITEGGRRVLLSGCSHRGIVNIMSWFSPDVLIGGFHFMNFDPAGDGKATLDAAVKELTPYPTAYYTCHCTGVAQYQYLKKQMNDQLHYLSCGQEIIL